MKAMVLAAGFGKRLRPLTLERPKPLVEVNGRTLLDRTYDHLRRGGVKACVTNIHYLGEQIVAHAAGRDDLNIQISDERGEILETAGGIIRALPDLGEAPFVSVNADTFWVEEPDATPVIGRMRDAFDPQSMDMLLLVVRQERATGHSGSTDFVFTDGTGLARAIGGEPGYIYAGVVIMHPRIFADAEAVPHSLNVYFDRTIAAGRLHGMVLDDGHWYTVSTPQSLVDVEAHLRTHGDMDIVAA
ncbi:MAG: nucleotidyltransferase family protein [Pseudomonadota bacterium]